MKRKHTLDEQIKRMKQLSAYDKSAGKYQFLNEDAPANIVGQPAQQQVVTLQPATQPQQAQQNPEIQINQMIDNPQFEQELDKAMVQISQSLGNDLQQIAKSNGDRDGQLEVKEQIGEAGGLLIASTVLAAPKIIEYMGKGLQKLGVKVSNQTLQKMGGKLSHFGHAIHHKYVGVIEAILKPITGYMDDQQRHILAGQILTMIVAGMGIASISGAISAAQAGHSALAATEGGLSLIKGTELAEKVRELLPAALQAGGVS